MPVMRAYGFDQSQSPSTARDLERHEIDTEYTLESWLHANPEVILNEPLLIFGRQYSLDTGIPDLLALDQWGNVVVIEIKKGQSGSGSASEETILSQPQNYAQSLSGYDYENLEDIYREYKTNIRDGKWNIGESAIIEDSLKDAHEKALGGSINQSEFNSHQRMVILAEKITSRTENNARYLLEQGLAVQCVAVQCFQFSDETAVDNSLLMSSTVVDYPLSRVQPENSKVDYSDLLLKIRDRVYSEIAEMCHFDEPGDMHRSGVRALGFNSHHPDHPSVVRYRFKPRMIEEGRAMVSLDLWGSDEDEKEQVREVVAEHADALESFNTVDEYEPTSNLVYLEFEAMDPEPDEEFVDAAVEKMVRLINFYHPKFIEQIDDE